MVTELEGALPMPDQFDRWRVRTTKFAGLVLVIPLLLGAKACDGSGGDGGCNPKHEFGTVKEIDPPTGKDPATARVDPDKGLPYWTRDLSFTEYVSLNQSLEEKAGRYRRDKGCGIDKYVGTRH